MSTEMLLLAVLALFAGAVVVAAIARRRPVKTLLFSAGAGLLGLAAVNTIGGMWGVDLGYGALNLAVASFFSIPGVVTLLLLRLF